MGCRWAATLQTGPSCAAQLTACQYVHSSQTTAQIRSKPAAHGPGHPAAPTHVGALDLDPLHHAVAVPQRQVAPAAALQPQRRPIDELLLLQDRGEGRVKCQARREVDGSIAAPRASLGRQDACNLHAQGSHRTQQSKRKRTDTMLISSTVGRRTRNSSRQMRQVGCPRDGNRAMRGLPDCRG